ncbi:hypothetical protein ACFPOA_08630 [Lysobacter niabensis]|uniref:hypothetical protein n=1 Tax=Agrilutibacter niabensis TaxID=380628 RepID=UPI00360B0EF5
MNNERMNPIPARRLVPKASLGAAALCIAALSPSAHAAQGEGWDWMVAPYVWVVGIDTDLDRTTPPEGGASTDTSFNDVLDKFDGAFLIHAEGQGDSFGAFTDFIYLGLADDHDHPRFSTESDLDARLFEIAGVWSPGPERYRGLEMFAGLRYIDIDLTVAFDPANPAFNRSTLDSSDSYNDLMLGARYTWALSDRWDLTLRGDGSFGDTEGTWNASVLAKGRMGYGALLFSYRYLSGELETNDSSIDITLSGPMVGYAFTF